MTREEAKEYLTPKEFEAWELKEQGLTAKDIAEKWNVRTSYVNTLFRKIERRFRVKENPPSFSWVRFEDRLKTPVSNMELIVEFGEDNTAVLQLTPKQIKDVIKAIGVEKFDMQVEAYDREKDSHILNRVYQKLHS